MREKNKNTTIKLLIFSKSIIVISIIFFSILLLYSIYKIFFPPELVSLKFYTISLISSFVIILILFISLKYFSDKSKVNFSLFLFTLGIIFYSLELFISIIDNNFFSKIHSSNTDIKTLSKKMKKPYDERNKIEVINDLNKIGYEAYPNINPLNFAYNDGFYLKKNKIYPLSSISNAYSVFTKETGVYTVIKTDRFGFNNPDKVYENKAEIIAMIGDSFAEGYAAEENKDIGSVLRNLNLNVINFGKASSGPLIEMAILREYALPLKPKIVLWFFYKNDLNDLKIEMKSSILKKYFLDNNFSQNLRFKQSDINEILKKFIVLRKNDFQNYKKKKNNIIFKDLGIKLINFFKLTQLRSIINFRPNISPAFKDIISLSKKNIDEFGGKMYFVYLPPLERYSNEIEYHNKDKIFEIIENLNIPIIDIHEDAFKNHPNPLSLFPFKVGVHYNSEGYDIVGKAIFNRLIKDKIISR